MALLAGKRLLVAALALALPLTAFVPIVGAAGKGAANARPSEDKADGGLPAASLPAHVEKYDSENVIALSKFMETCILGNNKYVSKDFAGALQLYKKAVALAPKNPLAPYLIAEAHLALGSLADADASLKQAEGNADERNPALRAKILFLSADVLERQKKWGEAKVAWQALGDYVGKHADAGAPLSAPARVQSIDDMMKQDKAYEIVRQRILAERDAGPEDAALPKK